MKLNLKFFTEGTTPMLPSSSDDDKGKIYFDQINDRIGANNFWFGSTKLPLSGGLMSGPIRWGTGNYANASLILNSKPIIADNANNGGINNDYRYLYRFNSGIELGNHHMYLRLLSDNSLGTAGQSNGLSGDIWHYISSNNRIDGTISKYIMLDTRNSALSEITSGNNANLGYSLKIGYGEANVLGIGKLSPSLSMGIGDDDTKLSLSIGGETASVVISKANYANFAGSANTASSASYAVAAGTSTGFTGGYFTTSTESQEIEPDNGDGNIIKTLELIPGVSSLKNKIIIGEGLKIEKIPSGSGSITANPNSYNIKISISDEILNRIAALEARSITTYEYIH